MRFKGKGEAGRAGWWKTALFWLGVTFLLALIPEIYGLFGRPGARVFSLLVMLAAVVALAFFLLRNLFERLHGDKPYGSDLKFAVIASLLGFAAAFIVAASVTAILLFALRLELTPEPGFGPEVVVGMVVGAVLFAPLFCLPMAALSDVTYSREFWRTYGQMLRKSALPLLGMAAVCLAAGAAAGAFIPGVWGMILSAAATAGMLVGAGEWVIGTCVYRRG
jgi:hypothetical protein